MMLFELTEKQQHEGELNISSSDGQLNQTPSETVQNAHETLKGAYPPIVDKIQSIARPILRSLGLDLFEIEFSGTVLRIFIDKAEGVTLDECAKASRHLGIALEVEETISESYTLEVSSPGLDRPLRNRDDYRRFIDKKVKIKTAIKFRDHPFGDQRIFVGRLLEIESDIVSVSLSGGGKMNRGGKIDIPFDQIERARLEVELSVGRNERTKKGGNQV